ncbi:MULTISPECIES: hypothetical protein [Altibacter]|uniref:hypothetical protein n=1 Tax=Altibacter TaxID=1535231 RepID=UPI0005528CE2|nr:MULTISPECIES: hypothetical protein [Altibacter]MCW9036287.1 hypothetical protein [Altibacter sp.]
MATRKKQNFLQKFLSDTREYPALAAVAAGLYPVFFYFTNNYTLINTWGHVGYFTLFFLVVPVIGFWLIHKLSKRFVPIRWQKYILPFLNVFVFLFLLKVCLYAGLQKKMTLGILVIAALFSYFLYKHLKKVIVLQLLLALIATFTLIPTIISQLNYSKEWMEQPDAIEQAIFTKRPNVYLIQPDGYANFSEIDRGYYNLDNSKFETYLLSNGFKNYPNFRSNYPSTLSSNSATFVMKHHYFNRGVSFSEAVNARNVIISNNAVLNIFKQNGYKTHFLAEMPYLLLNRPEIGYDYANFSYKDISYIGTGLGVRQDILEPLTETLQMDPEKPKFFFIEIFNPGHIHGRKADSKGVEGERMLWEESLKNANGMLTKTIDIILDKDPEALVVIMADHGGFVGMEYTNQIYTKTQDRDLIYSIFTSQLSIHWPNNDAPEFDTEIRTPVNLFRYLFSYLADNNTYLNHLQEDESFVIINEGAPKGVYSYIDSEGNIVFKKI